MKQGVEINKKSDFFYLSGNLDEYSNFSPLLESSPLLKIDLQRVIKFNSIGIRNLLEFLAKIGEKPFEYYNCPTEFIDQVNMIPALLGVNGKNGKIKSFVIPFFCDGCEYEEEVLKDTEEIWKQIQLKNFPTKICPKCQEKMTVFSDVYFSFLAR